MKSVIKSAMLAGVASMGFAAPSFAEEVNVAFFLQWPYAEPCLEDQRCLRRRHGR